MPFTVVTLPPISHDRTGELADMQDAKYVVFRAGDSGTFIADPPRRFY